MNNLLIHYTRLGEYKFCSHLELKAFWEKVFRKTGLPVKYSQGFNPQIKISFPWALPVNVCSFDEILSIEFTNEVSIRAVTEKLIQILPAEIGIKKIKLAGNRIKITPEMFIYRINIEQDYNRRELIEKIMSVLCSEEIFVSREKKGNKKKVNVRQFIRNIEFLPNNQLFLEIYFTDKGSIKITEVLELIGLHPTKQSIFKMRSIYRINQQNSNETEGSAKKNV